MAEVPTTSSYHASSQAVDTDTYEPLVTGDIQLITKHHVDDAKQLIIYHHAMVQCPLAGRLISTNLSRLASCNFAKPHPADIKPSRKIQLSRQKKT